jgi:AraC-like DNA-binding protein/mannose-6-phosphate isomerase-like protein (cupin superfamily)
MSKSLKKSLSAAETRAFLREAGLESARSSAFAFYDAAVGRSYALHAHRRHQVMYAVSGSATLEVADAVFLLPPQRAAFIPAGTKHVTHVGNAQTISLFLDARLVRGAAPEVQVMDITPLMREMIVFSARWPPSRRAKDALANAFFGNFGLLLEEWLAGAPSYRLPRGRTPEIKHAIDLIIARSGALGLPELCRAVGASERSLRRHLLAETGLSFRELSATARVLRSMELLASGGYSVTDAAMAVGFNSLSAFAKSFARVTGELPRAFRERVCPGKMPG